MPVIITATDFSEAAQNAVSYACGLALANNAQVIIIHSFIFPVMFSDTSLPTMLVDDAQKDAERQMTTLIADLQGQYTGINITGNVVYGDLIDNLEDYALKNEGLWLIVLGNSSSGENTSWPDSILLDALRSLKYPVLGVPREAVYSPVNKICFAFDNKHTGNDIALVQLREIAIQLKAELHILNAQPDVLNRDNILDIDDAAKQLLARANPQYHIVYETDVDAAIREFIAGNNIDWLILMPRKHSFFEGLLHKSHTKTIAQSIHVPILALHENRES